MSLALKLALAPLLVAQAMATRRRAPVLPEAEGAREGRVGEGERLALLIVGDSSAAGVGVATQEEALAGHLTRTLAHEAQRRVSWQLVARSGITTAQALELVRQVRPMPAEIAVAPAGTRSASVTAPLATARWSRTEMVRSSPLDRRAAGDGWSSRESYTRPGVMAWKAPAVVRPPILRHVPGVPSAVHSHTS